MRIAAYHLQVFKYKKETSEAAAKAIAADSGRATLEDAPPAEEGLPDGETAQKIVSLAKAEANTDAISSTSDIVAHAAKLVGSFSTTDFDIRFNPDCYCDTVAHADSEELEKQRALCKEAATFLLTTQIPTLVRDCLEHTSAPVDGQSLVESMHARGINVRYLGKVVACLADVPQLDYVHRVGLVELLARATKHVFRAYLQEVGACNTAAGVAHFLNCLLGVVNQPATSVHADIVRVSTKERSKKKSKATNVASTRLFNGLPIFVD